MSVAFSQVTSRLRSVNATDAPPVHWPSALVGLLLAVVVVVSISWLAAPRRSDRVAGSAAVSVMPPVATVLPTPIPPPPVATPEPEPAVERVRVALTGGAGVNLRARAGERGQRLKTMPEGAVLEIVGGDVLADGLTWRQVRDAAGTTGWVAGKFVVRVQP
jgi:hypothetical protein